MRRSGSGLVRRQAVEQRSRVRLGLDAYQQLANVDSGLTRAGQAICAAIEAASGSPTYFYLHCYYTRPPERAHQCPVCGASWTFAETAERPGLDRFPRGRDPCRLVSVEGDDTLQRARQPEDLDEKPD